VLEEAGIVVVTRGRRGTMSIIRLENGFQHPSSAPENLVPQRLSEVIRFLVSSLQSKLSAKHVRCVIFGYRDLTNGSLTAIPVNTQDELVTAIKNALVSSADEVMAKHGFFLNDLIIVTRAAWLRQLLGMTRHISREVHETFDSPPILGMKPHPHQLFDALFGEDEPPSPTQIENWLRRDLIEPSQTGYSFTNKGLHAIRVKSKLHLRPRRESLRIGQRTLYLIYA